MLKGKSSTSLRVGCYYEYREKTRGEQGRIYSMYTSKNESLTDPCTHTSSYSYGFASLKIAISEKMRFDHAYVEAEAFFVCDSEDSDSSRIDGIAMQHGIAMQYGIAMHMARNVDRLGNLQN